MKEGHPFDNADGARTYLWGPPLWLFLSVMARVYKVNPTPEDRRDYADFVYALGKVLPCRSCREHYPQNLVDTGFDPEVDLLDRQSFSRFINRLHNHINKQLGKGVHVSYEEHREMFEAFKAKCVPSKKGGGPGGCYGSRGEADSRPTCIMKIVPEARANASKRRHGGRSMHVSRDCVPAKSRRRRRRKGSR